MTRLAQTSESSAARYPSPASCKQHCGFKHSTAITAWLCLRAQGVQGFQRTSNCLNRPERRSTRSQWCLSVTAATHLKHGGRKLGEVAAQEARVRLGNLDQQLQRVLRAGFLALVQQAPHHRQLRRDRRLELVALRRVLQLLAQPARTSSCHFSACAMRDAAL